MVRPKQDRTGLGRMYRDRTGRFRRGHDRVRQEKTTGEDKNETEQYGEGQLGTGLERKGWDRKNRIENDSTRERKEHR